MYIVGLVFGILGFIWGIVPFAGWQAVPLNLVAIFIGINGRSKRDLIPRGEHQMATAALVLGIIPLLLKIPTILVLLSL